MIIAYEENGISKEREATAEEIAYIESAQAEAQASKAIEEAEIAERASAKAAVLSKLGLTEDEMAALL
jgi:hypothetical protein